MKTLVIEDQPIAATLLMSTLRALGCEAEHVADATTAWGRICEGGFRVVVSDWRMPGLDGLGLCRMIREQGGDYIYFILVSTSRPTKENRRLALEAGVDDFLVKPVDPDELGMRLHVAERIVGLTAKVKKLEELMPICGYCKKVRDDQKYWKEIETLLQEQQGTKFSHGVCPDCYERVLVPQMKAMGIESPPKFKDTD